MESISSLLVRATLLLLLHECHEEWMIRWKRNGHVAIRGRLSEWYVVWCHTVSEEGISSQCHTLTAGFSLIAEKRCHHLLRTYSVRTAVLLITGIPVILTILRCVILLLTAVLLSTVTWRMICTWWWRLE